MYRMYVHVCDSEYCCCLFVCCFQLLHTAFNQLKHDVRQGCVHLEGIDGSTQDEVRHFSQPTSSSFFHLLHYILPSLPSYHHRYHLHHHHHLHHHYYTFVSSLSSTSTLISLLFLLLLLQELFYSLPPGGTYGSVSYMAKAVVNQLLIAGIHSDPTDRNNCSIS